MARAFTSFIGVNLGGGRGKTTAIARLRTAQAGSGAEVMEVATRAGQAAWTDDTLVNYLASPAPDTVLAIDAPLTATSCGRCERPVCPGMETCEEPAVGWLRTTGRALVQNVAVETVGGAPRSIDPHSHSGVLRAAPAQRASVTLPQARLAPYAHRATDVVMTYQRGLLPLAALGATNGAIAARAGQLRRRLRGTGYRQHENLIEVSPAATVAALCGTRAARGYKRDADAWRSRAAVLERLELTFAPQSRFAREDVLRNDHCFDAVIAAYTAFLWARDAWPAPEGVFADDGWIYAPP